MRYLPRKRLLVDPKVQGALLGRAAMYWLLFAVALCQIVLGWEIATGPNGPFISHFRFLQVIKEYWVVLVAGLLMLPILLFDVAFISNRIVGPLNRVRSTLRALAEGRKVAPIEFREGDYFWAMASELNAVSARMAELEAKLMETSKAEAPTKEFAEPFVPQMSSRPSR